MAKRVRTPTSEEQKMVSGVVERMRKARDAAQISREEVAYRLGVDFSTIGRWERGDSKDGPPLWAVWGYARLVGVPVAHLLGEDVPVESMQAALLEALRDRMTRFDRDFDEMQRLIDRLDDSKAI